MSEWEITLEAARKALPLDRLMEQRGHGANGGKFAKCPFCGKKGGVGFFNTGHQLLFKCHHNSCPSGTAAEGGAWDEVGYLAYTCNINRSEACRLLMREAGVWKEPRLAPSVMPGKGARKRPMPQEPQPGDRDFNQALPVTESDTQPPASELSEPEHTAEGLSAFQEGKSQADVEGVNGSSPTPSEITEDARNRIRRADSEDDADGVDASSEGQPPRPVTDEATNLAASAATTAADASLQSKDSETSAPSDFDRDVAKDDDEDLVQQCVQVIREEKKASVSLLQRRLRLGYTRASRIMDALEKRGFVGPAKGAEPRDILIPEVSDEEIKKIAKAVVTNWTEFKNFEDLAKALEPTNIVLLPPPPPVPPKQGGGGGGSGAPPSIEALRYFYGRLALNDRDREELWRKRGLTARTCEMAGLKSNPKSNHEILLEMPNKFPMAALMDSGLFNQENKPNSKPKPNAQFYGYGLIARAKKKDEEDTWGWCEPILIPYFDKHGEVVHLRPHKGGAKERNPRLYIVRRAKEFRLEERDKWSAQYAFITEGEFKGLALWQALAQDQGDDVAIATLPGITMSKPLFGDIEDWLDETWAEEGALTKQVLVGFDNEEKGDDKLPGYNEKPWKRHDSQIWARYLAKAVTKEGYDGRLCNLPNAWRDANGKVDWDGALAKLIARFHKPASGLSNELWQAVAEKVRTEFLTVIRAASPVNEQYLLFEGEEERHIQNGLASISYVPKLPIGGDGETSTARRLQRCSRKVKGNTARMAAKDANYLLFLAERYLDLKGRYYVLKRLTDAKVEHWSVLRNKAHEREDTEAKRACELVLLGIPEWITDFYMECRYELRKADGTRDRLVTLHGIHGRKTGLTALPSAAFAQPSKWREWLLNQGGFTWRAGERELNDLQADIARATARLEVEQVPLRGWHEETKLWFFDDVVFTADGEEKIPDVSGIVWYEKQGYKLGEYDQERQEFVQGSPKMHPARPYTEEQTRNLFVELASKMYDTLGGYDGYLVLGLMMACGAGPEIFKKFTAFPGLWLHGESNQGKSSVAKWLLRLWGFKNESGMPLADSTKVGLSIALQQYGNLFVWLEEFQPDAPRWMVEKIKNAFNRESGNKKTFDDARRKILAGLLVTGVATSQNAQVRSRYAHVSVSAKNRIGPGHYEWFEKESPNFFFLGRWILHHRKEFAKQTLDTMTRFMEHESMRNADPRARIVHGVAYAGFMAMVSLLQSHASEKLLGFRAFLVAHCMEQVKETREQADVNQFWTDLLAAFEGHAFGHSATDWTKVFKVAPSKEKPLELPEDQLATAAEEPSKEWKSYRLYFRPEVVINTVKDYKRRHGVMVHLERGDLQAQMRTRPYWVQYRSGELHKQNFGSEDGNKSCWCIELDQHDLGYQKVSAEEWQASLYKDGDPGTGVGIPRSDWIDPRKGDLFMLVDALMKRQQPKEEHERNAA